MLYASRSTTPRRRRCVIPSEQPKARILAENGAALCPYESALPRARLENRSLGAEIDKRSDVRAAWYKLHYRQFSKGNPDLRPDGWRGVSSDQKEYALRVREMFR